MSNKKILKNSLPTERQIVKLNAIKELIPADKSRVPAFPGWALIMLLGCIRHKQIAVSFLDTVQIMQLFTTNVYTASTFVGHDTDPIEKQQQEAQKLLDRYLDAYKHDRIPVEHYKTFAKSIKSSIAFLKAMDEEKGRRFTVDRELPCYPPKDVRLFTDLVYLQQEGYIELPQVEHFMIRDEYVDSLEVKMLTDAGSMEAVFVAPTPDAEHLGLQLYIDEKELVYQNETVSNLRVTTKACKLLEHMMLNKVPFPLEDACKLVDIEKNVNDKTGRTRMENVVNTVNTHLRDVKFTHELGFASNAIVWKKALPKA